MLDQKKKKKVFTKNRAEFEKLYPASTGTGDANNRQVSHPFFNTGYKN